LIDENIDAAVKNIGVLMTEGVSAFSNKIGLLKQKK